MKALAAFLILLPINSQAAQLCVKRLEDEGYPNIYPVALMQGKREVASLLGGEKACVAMKASADTVWVRWHAFDWNRTDHGSRNERLLHSPYTIAVRSKGVEQIDMKICSKRAQGETPIWHISGDGLGDCP